YPRGGARGNSPDFCREGIYWRLARSNRRSHRVGPQAMGRYDAHRRVGYPARGSLPAASSVGHVCRVYSSRYGTFASSVLRGMAWTPLHFLSERTRHSRNVCHYRRHTWPDNGGTSL